MIKIYNYHFKIIKNEFDKIYLVIAADSFKNALKIVNDKIHDIYFLGAIEEGIKVNFLCKEEI